MAATDPFISDSRDAGKMGSQYLKEYLASIERPDDFGSDRLKSFADWDSGLSIRNFLEQVHDKKFIIAYMDGCGPCKRLASKIKNHKDGPKHVRCIEAHWFAQVPNQEVWKAVVGAPPEGFPSVYVQVAFGKWVKAEREADIDKVVAEAGWDVTKLTGEGLLTACAEKDFEAKECQAPTNTNTNTDTALEMYECKADKRRACLDNIDDTDYVMLFKAKLTPNDKEWIDEVIEWAADLHRRKLIRGKVCVIPGDVLHEIAHTLIQYGWEINEWYSRRDGPDHILVNPLNGKQISLDLIEKEAVETQKALQGRY
jgi:hypothetical protein